MASTINAKTTGVGGIDASGDASGVLALQTGGTTAVTIDTFANVGIGTGSPTNRLEVFGDGSTNQRIAARANTTANMSQIEAQVTNYWSGATYTGTSIRQFGSTAAGTTVGLANANLGVLNFQNGSAGLITTNGATPLVFSTYNTERMRLDSSGNLLVGTTTVQGIGITISGSYMYQRSSATAGVFRYTGGDTANNYVVYNQSNIGVYLTNGGFSWLASTSDARLKNKVSDIENALEAVQKLKALTFRYKKEDQTITPRYGFFAQNVGEAIPDAMIISPEKDENIEGDIYTYDAAIINVYMVKAIQEQQTLIEALTARLTALEAK